MRAAHVALVLTLVACGGGAAVAPGPSSPPPGPASGPSTGAPSASASAASPVASSTGAPVAPVEMHPPVPSAMVAELKAFGLDAAHLPPIEKLDPKTLRGVMKLLSKSLGAKCGDCHSEGDFAAPTRRKKIAAKMWDEFAAKLDKADGAPLFCDSCHQGHIKTLDRSDKKALGRWMDVAFVQGLHRKDGKGVECETCHVGWDMTFLTSWGK